MWGLKNIPSLSIHERFTSLSNSRRFWKNKNVFPPNFPKWQVHNDFSKKHIWFLCMWFNPDLQHRLGDIINGTIIPVLYFFLNNLLMHIWDTAFTYSFMKFSQPRFQSRIWMFKFLSFISGLTGIYMIIKKWIHHVHTFWETANAACSGVMLSNGINAVKSSHRTMPKL